MGSSDISGYRLQQSKEAAISHCAFGIATRRVIHLSLRAGISQNASHWPELEYWNDARGAVYYRTPAKSGHNVLPRASTTIVNQITKEMVTTAAIRAICNIGKA